MTTFGEAIQAVIDFRHGNQRVLREQAGLAKNTVSKLLKSLDGQDVHPRTIQKALVALQISEEDVRRIWRDGEDVAAVLDADERRIRAALATLTLDRTVDLAVRDRVESWALAEGRRLEVENGRGSRANYDGMLRRFLIALGSVFLRAHLASNGMNSDGVERSHR